MLEFTRRTNVTHMLMFTRKINITHDEELWTQDETTLYTSYICTICGRRCVSRNDMKRHVRVHTGERPYVCEHCGRAFKIKHHLKDRVRVHLKDLM